MAAAAGIGAAGSIIGGALTGKGAKKAAKIQAQTAREQIAATQANQKYIYGLEAPTIDRGNAAGTTMAGLLGIGGYPAASAAALETFRGSNGYQDLLKTGLDAVNSNAYARGMGNSGATLKALQTRGSNIADQSQQQYLGNLSQLNTLGTNAIGNVSGVATNATNSINAANQSAANANSQAAVTTAAGWSQALQGLGNAAGSYLGSSYGGGGVSGGGVPMNYPSFGTPPYAPVGVYGR